MDLSKRLSFVLFGFLIVFCLYFKLSWCLISAVATYSLLDFTYKYFDLRFKSNLAHKITTFVLLIIITFIITILSLSIYKVSHLSSSTINQLMTTVQSSINQLSIMIPNDYRELFPDNIDELKSLIGEHLKTNSSTIVVQTSLLFKGLTHIIIGIIIGAMISFSNFSKLKNEPVGLSMHLRERAHTFKSVFNNVVLAQLKISAINTTATAIFIVGILPIFDAKLQHSGLLIIITFICGLVPIVGNLLSNTLIVAVSLMDSLYTACFALLFLIVIHKLEYYINAKIIGNKINIQIWEMLIVMIAFETLFGITGLALSPIFYGYIKTELNKLNLL